MAEIVFAIEIRGKGMPVDGKENTFHVEGSGTGSQGAQPQCAFWAVHGGSINWHGMCIHLGEFRFKHS